MRNDRHLLRASTLFILLGLFLLSLLVATNAWAQPTTKPTSSRPVLTGLAVGVAAVDAGLSCKRFADGYRELGPVLWYLSNKHQGEGLRVHPAVGCGIVVGIKAAFLLPLAFDIHPNLRLGLQVANITAGSAAIVMTAVRW